MGIDDKKDEAFINKAKSLLDDAADNLDEKTMSRLRQARIRALESAKDGASINWMIPASGLAAVATVSVLTISIWTAKPVEHELADAFNDIELLTSTESLEFYEELEFYAWIDEQNAKG